MISVSPRRCFCVDCLDILVGAGAANSARDLDPWRCYMCQPLQLYGVLKKRHDWSLKLQEFFVNDNGQEFVSLTLTFIQREILCLQNCRFLVIHYINFHFLSGKSKDLPCSPSRAETSNQSPFTVWWHCHRLIWYLFGFFIHLFRVYYQN